MKTRKARCKHVLAVINNTLETLPLLREEIWPPMGDFQDYDNQIAIVYYEGAGSYNEVMIPLESVVFLKD